MAYTIEQQYSRDIDWYFMDGSKNLFHVTSAGGRLPAIIAENDELNNRIHFQAQQFDEEFEIIINPNLAEIKAFESEERRELYLADFIQMAKKGFISIDKTVLGNFENTMYHIVAWPKNPKIHHVFENIVSVQNNIETTNLKSFDLFKVFEND